MENRFTSTELALSEDTYQTNFCELYVNYTTFFSKNNPFLKFVDFCIIDQNIAFEEQNLVKNNEMAGIEREIQF